MAAPAGTGEDERWIEGPVLDDVLLASAVHEHWALAAQLAGEQDAVRAVPGAVDDASALLEDAAALLVRELERPAPAADHAEAARLLVEGSRLTVRTIDAGVRWRARAFTRVHAALGRLRAATSVQQLMTMAPAELCTCGFDRAMLSRVEGTLAIPQAFHWEGDPERAAEMVRAGQQEPIELTHTRLETEMIRRRGPLLVADPQGDPRVHRLLAEVSGSRRYVAAPIMPQGTVIGLVHADCHVQRRLVDEFDRDLLWMFAEGFGFAYERAVLLEKLRSLRAEVRRGSQSVMAVMDEFCEAEVEVARIEGEQRATVLPAPLPTLRASRVESLLTPRELDVIRLMAMGHTNSQIAIKLTVSEGTVKSHVKNILRKLRASNRAEAVSRFVRLSQQAPPPGER